MSSREASQRAAVLAALKAGRALTAVDAIRDYGCFRLAARIYELRLAGHTIATLWGSDAERRWAIYRLLKSSHRGANK